MSEWQSIESAPRDGTWFMAFRPALPAGEGTWATLFAATWDDELQDFVWPDGIYDPYNPPDLAEQDDDGFYLHSPYEAGGSITHWMPLPEPPMVAAVGFEPTTSSV